MLTLDRLSRRAAFIALIGIAGTSLQGGTALAQRAPEVKANWALANKFSPEATRDVIYSTSVNARFINKTDSAWYYWKDRNGSRFMLVVPKTRTKQPLFDHARLAADLTALHHRPFEPHNLPFTTIEFDDSTNASVFQFRVDSMLYKYDMRTSTLTSLGRAPRDTANDAGSGRGGGGGPGNNRANRDFRNFSPDSSAFVSRATTTSSTWTSRAAIPCRSRRMGLKTTASARATRRSRGSSAATMAMMRTAIVRVTRESAQT